MNHVRLFSLLVISLVGVLLLPTSGFTNVHSDQGASRPIASPTPPIEAAEDIIRIKTNLVQVDVVAVDDKGQQVTGLAAADFKIIDNGKERVPEFVTYVSLARDPANGSRVTGHPSANELGRVIVFAVSNPVIQFGFSSPGTGGGTPRIGTFTTQAMAVRAADSAQSLMSWFIDTQMTDADLIAIVSMQVDLGVLSSFTNDRAVLGAAMKQVHGAVRGPTINLTAVGREISLQPLAELNLRVMETLENVIKQVETLPGRKVVTLLSGGLLYNPNLPYSQVIKERMERLIKKANEARIAIYTLHTRDLDLNSPLRGNDGLVHLARQTGGRALYNTNDLRIAFDRIIEENRGYYLLAYDPGADLRERPANIEVRVNRSHVKVLSRAEGLVQRAVNARGQLAGNPFASPLSSTDIGLNIASAIAPNTKGQVTTSCRVDLSKVTVRGSEGGRQNISLGLSIRVAGPDGRDFKKADRDLSFDLSEAELEITRREGVSSTFSFAGEKPGFYRISVAVRDNYSGKVGNSRVFVEVSKKDLSKGPG